MIQEKKISFSELKTWSECPYKHKLKYIENLEGFKGNEYTAFGTAIHHVCESLVEKKAPIDSSIEFEKKFEEELSKLDILINKDLVADMRPQGKRILPFIMPGLEKVFGSYEVISTEEELMVPIPGSERKFKGFIDLVIRTEEGKYHIIDWKTCSWGWDSRRKSDKITNYQLVLYKKFFALKHNLDLSQLETHFALLKRTAKKENVEIFKVPSGRKRVENCTKFLMNAIKNISKKMYIKNRLSCRSCNFYKTEHCN